MPPDALGKGSLSLIDNIISCPFYLFVNCDYHVYDFCFMCMLFPFCHCYLVTVESSIDLMLFLHCRYIVKIVVRLLYLPRMVK